MSKNIIIGIIAFILTTIIFGAVLVTNKAEVFGAISEGIYKKLTTGTDQAVTYGPSILHRIVIGTANDSVFIGDVEYAATASTSDNAVFNITATTPMVFDVETVFPAGIMANVTSSNGVVFITSPQ